MLTVAHLITGLETGGAERMLARLVTTIDPARFRSVVISLTGPGTIGPEIAAAGIPLHSLGARRGLPDPRPLARLFRILGECRPDIVQTWLPHADLVGSLARLGRRAPRLVWNIRATEMLRAGVVRRVLARLSRLPDAVVVNAEAARRYHEGLGYRPRRWVHIPNGFDTAALRPDPTMRELQRTLLGLPDEAVAILLPARYHPVKDHGNFLEAARLLAARRPEAWFVLAGAGTGRDNPALAVPELGDRLLRLGERPDLARLYPAFDTVTLSSAVGEGFPNVLGEAMLCGIPCVATDSGDAGLIIGDPDRVVPPRDPDALAAAWDRVIALGAEGRRAVGAAGRARIAAEYDLGAIVGRYEALYEGIAVS
ncbi:MAG TPA: glycosyltransferase [Stellaceae bacterium]|nr:glycosyltransferase [Stellaceae bacterium]